MKKPANALESRLRRLGKYDELMTALIEEGVSLKDAHERCGGWGLETSTTALSRLLRSCGLEWRSERAREVAERTLGLLPEDWEEAKRRGLSQQLFEKTFSDLSVKELVALKSIELEEAKLQVTLAKLEHEITKFREQLRTKMEAGMDALFEEIKSNPAALKIFRQLKETLREAAA